MFFLCGLWNFWEHLLWWASGKASDFDILLGKFFLFSFFCNLYLKCVTYQTFCNLYLFFNARNIFFTYFTYLLTFSCILKNYSCTILNVKYSLRTKSFAKRFNLGGWNSFRISFCYIFLFLSFFLASLTKWLSPHLQTVMYYAIWYHLYSFKNVKNIHGGASTSNFTKINTPSRVFFRF